MTLSEFDQVGDFQRVKIPEILEMYRDILQGVLNDPKADQTTKTSVTKRLDLLQKLGDQWRAAWLRCRIDHGRTAQEHDAITNAVLEAEKRLTKECPHIFELSYYRPVWKKIPDNLEI